MRTQKHEWPVGEDPAEQVELPAQKDEQVLSGCPVHGQEPWLDGTVTPLRPTAIGGSPADIQTHTMTTWDFLKFLSHTLTTLQRFADDGNGLASFRFMNQGLHVGLDPSVLKQVFVEHPHRYEKLYEQLVSIAGRSSLLTSGEAWQKRRERTYPMFRGRLLERRLAEEHAKLFQFIDRFGPRRSAQVPIFEFTGDLSFGMAARLFLGCDLDPGPPEVRQSIFKVAEVDEWTLGTVFPPWRWILRALTPGYGAAKQHWLETRMKIASQADPNAPVPGVQHFWRKAMLENPDPEIDEQALSDEIATSIVAGAHTGATVLGFALHLLSHHPQWLEAVEQEAQSAWSDGVTDDPLDYKKLTITKAVIMETMRLYPPVWVLSRKAIEPHQLGSSQVQVGDAVIVPVLTVQRSAQLWDEPNSFRPERFLNRSSYGFAYLPYGAGPRTCVGSRFAGFQQPAQLSAILKRYKIAAMPGTAPLTLPELLPGAAVTGRKPLMMHMTPR